MSVGSVATEKFDMIFCDTFSIKNVNNFQLQSQSFWRNSEESVFNKLEFSNNNDNNITCKVKEKRTKMDKGTPPQT